MRESPRQPKNLDPLDRTELAVLGHRIEVWSTAKGDQGTLRERHDALVQALQRQVDAILHSKYELSPVELSELEEDLEYMRAFDGTDEEFTQFCDEREKYYVAVRDHYIRNLGGTEPTE